MHPVVPFFREVGAGEGVVCLHANASSRTAEKVVFAVEWALAVVLFESGLAQAGLPLGVAAAASEPALTLAGLVQPVAAVLLVVPGATRFFPALGSIVALAVAAVFGAAAAGAAVPVGLGSRPFALAVALTAGALAVVRGVLLPVAALDLGPERRDAWRRPAPQLGRIRR